MLPTSKGSGCRPLPSAQSSLVSFRTLVRALVRMSGDYEPMACLHIYMLACLFVYVFACVSVCACVSLTSYACFLCVNVYAYMCLLVCFHMFVCLSLSLKVVYVCVTLCLRMRLCVSAVSTYSSGSITWADP